MATTKRVVRKGPLFTRENIKYGREAVLRTLPVWATVLLLVLARTPAIGIS